MTPEKLAKLFHETYERLAPCFGYTTRPDSSVPWEKVPEKNRRLMTAVCDFVLETLTGEGCGPIDWTCFTPREVWAALASAPKVAGPWTANGSREYLFGGREICWRSTVSPDGRSFRCREDDDPDHDDDPTRFYATREDVDARLRELGWLLVDEPVAP